MRYLLHNLIVPPGALAALAWARTFHPDAFIAGGYLRDLYHGVQPKDLDIFTFADEMREGGHTVLDRAEWDEEQLEVYEGHRIADVEVPVAVEGCDVPVQIVHLHRALASTAGDAVAQFMVGLSQVWYEGDVPCCTPQFIHDSDHKSFTITRCDSPMELTRILHKIGELRKKYQYQIVIPNQFAGMLVEAV